MKRFFIYIMLIYIAFLSSCRVKDNCEINNTGKISVTNNYSRQIEIIINNTKLFNLEPGETKTTDKPVGSYNIKALSFPDEWNYQISIKQCETTQINVPE